MRTRARQSLRLSRVSSLFRLSSLKRKEYLEGFHSGRLLSIREFAQLTHVNQSVVLYALDRFGIVVQHRSTFCV